jgi:hypothetical protein
MYGDKLLSVIIFMSVFSHVNLVIAIINQNNSAINLLYSYKTM